MYKRDFYLEGTLADLGRSKLLPAKLRTALAASRGPVLRARVNRVRVDLYPFQLVRFLGASLVGDDLVPRTVTDGWYINLRISAHGDAGAARSLVSNMRSRWQSLSDEYESLEDRIVGLTADQKADFKRELEKRLGYSVTKAEAKARLTRRSRNLGGGLRVIPTVAEPAHVFPGD